MRKIFFLLFTTIHFFNANAQRNGSVQGVAFDTISRQTVPSATVTVLDRKDSSLLSFTMTDNYGRFSLKGLPNGEFRLLITHTGYHNSNINFSISDSAKTADLGNVVMNDKVKVLAEVVIANEAPPVTMINDTIQYNAGSFKVQPNSSVEQLLKKLPGVKVEKDGTVKAQGETVNRILVDGKEFFGNDPKVATRNLPADAVDKVQVYDRQSEQASLTGFEDGDSEKTINLKLKKDKKKGVFGKLNAGVGTDDRYAGKFNVNSFKGARQLSAIGMGNNTNAEGFSFMDILNFTGELARMQRSGGGGNININMSGEDAAAMGMNGANRNNGINTAWGGGLNYNNIIGTKFDLQSNYFFNRYNPNRESTVARQYLLPDSTYFSNEHAKTDNLSNNHRLNLNLLYQIDSMNSIRLIPSLSYQEMNNKSYSEYSTLSGARLMANQGFSEGTSQSEGFNFRNEIMWRKKFARKGRTFSLSLQTSLNESDGEGSLYSINSFYNSSGALAFRDTLDQQSKTKADLRGYNARAVYTEPLWKRSLVELSVGKSNTVSSSGKTTYDYDRNSGKYDHVNENFTNDFENTYSYLNTGLRIRTQRKKYNYSVGVSWQNAELQGKIISGIKDSLISKTFTNLLPNGRFQYNFSRFRSFSLNYNTSTTQPSMSQLQPVPDNSNPLNVRNGNPDLKQEFSHFLRANLNFVSPYKNKNFFLNLGLQATRNRIVNYDSVTNFGVKYTRPVNVNGVYNFNSSISYSLPVRFLQGTIEFSSVTGLSRNKQFIQQQENEISTFSFGPEIRLDIYPTEKLNIGVGANVNLNKAKYSLQSVLNNNYLSQEYNASLDWEMPKQFFFSTDFTYTINSQRAAGFNLKVPIWNAGISKQMLNFNRGELKLSVSDLLGENIGIRRNSNNNYIEDSRVMTLRRFFLLSFTYSLSKVGLNNNSQGGGMRVIRR